MDSISRGRFHRATGERVGTAKLTTALVLEIRRLYAAGKNIATIKRELNLEYLKWDTVNLAARAVTWANVMKEPTP